MDMQFDIERALKGKIKGGRLEKWTELKVFHPETKEYVGSAMYGSIYDDIRFPCGESMKTSKVEIIREDVGIVETKNAYYTLGEKGTDEDLKLHRMSVGY